MAELSEEMLLSGLKEYDLIKLAACIVANSKVACLGSFDADAGCATRARCTTAQHSAEELAGLVITVTDAPTLFNELWEGRQSQTLQGVEIYIIALAHTFNVLTLAIIRGYELLPEFQTLLHKEVLRSFRGEWNQVNTVYIGLG